MYGGYDHQRKSVEGELGHKSALECAGGRLWSMGGRELSDGDLVRGAGMGCRALATQQVDSLLR